MRLYHAHRLGGFTLIELSIVLLVISLMMGGLLAMLAQETRRDKMDELKMKMDAIEVALVSYSKRPSNYALPCPANPALDISHADFGFSASPGCTTGSGSRAIPAANRTVNSAAGTVPVRTLGLPDDYAFDPWGNKFTLVTSLLITATNALVTYPVNNTTASTLTTESTDGVAGVTAVAALISHGQNGFGSYGRSGARKAFFNNNAGEKANCGCSANSTTLVITDSASANIVYGAETTDVSAENIFDDKVRIYPRDVFLLTSDIIAP